MDRLLIGKQNEFHRLVQVFLNGGLFTKRDLLRGLLGSRRPIEVHASRIAEAYRELQLCEVENPEPRVEIVINEYKSNVSTVERLSINIAPVRKYIVGAFVHGSVGTYEEVPYSDFDALVVLRDSAFANVSTLVRVARVLSDCQSYMQEFDTLQHHGWFVLTEYDLRNYCEAYFPIALYDEAKSIVPLSKQRLSIQRRNSFFELNEAFCNLITSIQNTNLAKARLSAYHLKSYLSKIMLLPAFYYQAMDGVGLFKRDSFIRLREEFSSEDLFAIDLASTIRAEWSQHFGYARSNMYRAGLVFRRIFSRYIHVRPHADALRILDNRCTSKLARIVDKMRLNLAKNKGMSFDV